MMICVGFILVAVSTAACSAEASHDDVIVTTRAGRLQGTLLYIDGVDNPAYTFLNVPYAAPPTGEFRFKPPQPVKPWSDLRDATKHGPSCPYLRSALDELIEDVLGLDKSDKPFSEDCLHLDIYSPSLHGHYPVMVFLHGGGWMSGRSSDYDFRAYAILKDTLVVVIQRRLGALGFLTTGDHVVPGNMALLDKVTALTWVQENIALFGGNRGSVTLFGQSAGAVDIGVLMMLPIGKGLFHRGILQSGGLEGLNSFIQPSQDARSKSEHIAELLGCPLQPSTKMIKCLQSQPVIKILNPTGDGFTFQPGMWTYVIDGNIIQSALDINLETSQFDPDIAVMAGVTNVEGYRLAATFYPVVTEPGFDADELKSVIHERISSFYPQHPGTWDLLTKLVLRLYSKVEDDTQPIDAFAKFVGDHMITSPTHRTAEHYKDAGHFGAYFYDMSQRPSQIQRPDYIETDHGDELYFMTGTSYLGRFQYSQEDLKTEKLMVSYWTNFARCGNPNGEGLPFWPNMQDGNSYMELKAEPEVKHNFRKRKMIFWKQILPKIIEKDEVNKTYSEL